jgi:adenylate kinase
MVLNVIIFGAPGSGKGTQSAYIAEKYGLEHLSTGDLLRAEQQTQSQLGTLISSYTDQGNLVPDELIIDMLANVLDTKKNVNGFIFDGFPRTTAQAEALKEMLANRGIAVSIMLDLQVDEAELVDRLVKRGETSGRTDDNKETIMKRIEVYHAKTACVRDYYKKEGLAAEIKGSGSLQDVFGRINQAISSVQQ